MIPGDRKLSLQRTVKSPLWGSTIPERLAYLCWDLEQHPETVETFFQLADGHQRRKPGRRFSGSDVFAVMRWNGSGHAGDDTFRMNNNLCTCFVRLYVQERPESRKLLDLRKSWLDSLNAKEQEQLDDALARGRAKLEARNP